MTARRPNNWPRLAAWLRAAVLLAIALAASETLLVLGVLTPLRIHGSSMAPTLLGPHVDVRCPRCTWPFPVAAGQYVVDHPLVCPDCLHAFAATPSAIEPGERTLVNRFEVALADPDRWQVVVLRCPDRPSDLCVKRVIALPGEHIDFAAGDLLIDGKVVRKKLHEQIAARVLLHRERDALRHWQSSAGQWSWTGDGWTHTGPAERLAYDAQTLSPTDALGVNQTMPHRLHPATDLMLTAQFHLAEGAQLELVAEFNDGPSERTRLVGPRQGELLWSLFDRQVLLAIDHQVQSVEVRSTPWPAVPRLTARAEGDVRLGELSLWRDAYYHTRPADRWPPTGVRLGPEQFFVAGDNLAISQDSRNWRPHGVPRGLLLGRPIGVQ